MAEIAWWQKVQEIDSFLTQGELLPDCHIPTFNEILLNDNKPREGTLVKSDLIIITQTCDLVQSKVPFVSMCAIYSMQNFKQMNSDMSDSSIKERLESIRTGKIPRMHLLASPEFPEENQKAYVVDFGQILSMPIAAVKDHALKSSCRWQLKSPFLEHFSQALARFFMRVGLPSSIPPFKK